jgi:hypothetical protein
MAVSLLIALRRAVPIDKHQIVFDLPFELFFLGSLEPIPHLLGGDCPADVGEGGGEFLD